MKIEGPTLGHEKECFLGQSCDIRGVDGIGLRSGDRLMVLEECGQGVSIPGFPGLGIVEANEPERCLYEFISDVGMPGYEIILSSAAGIFRLCYCRAQGSELCESPMHFAAVTGLFFVKGPTEGQSFHCYIGTVCRVSSLRGIGLADGN